MAIADSICWTLGNGQTASRLTSFNGQSYGYGDSGPFHAVDRIGGSDRFDYDANGNMVKRNKGLAGQQTLVWDAQNRLSQVQDNNGDLLEQYWYDVDGARVKKISGSTTTYTFFSHYEEEVTGGVPTTVSHYSFGGLRIAVKRGSDLYHLHGDHLGSTSLTTDSARAATASRAYYAYGAERNSSGDLQTDRTFTGQKSDATGLMYYNARYYDPAVGTFISPDTIIPDPGLVVDYNRFLYARGNPLKFTDPSGQEAYCFLGGWNPDTTDLLNYFHVSCKKMLTEIGYTEDVHGKISIKGNFSPAANEVYEEILALKQRENPSPRPIVLACYSWGCPAAMEVARLLSGQRYDDAGQKSQAHAPVRVDLLVLIEAENSYHPLPLGRVPENVADSYHYYSYLAGKLDIQINLTALLGIKSDKDIVITFPATEGTWANGPDRIEGVDKTKTFAIPANHYNIWELLPWGFTPAKDAITGKDVRLPAFP